MTLMDLLECLVDPEHAGEKNVLLMEVVFDTAYRGGLTLLSCYVSEDGRIHLDIGDDDDD